MHPDWRQKNSRSLWDEYWQYWNLFSYINDERMGTHCIQHVAKKLSTTHQNTMINDYKSWLPFMISRFFRSWSYFKSWMLSNESLMTSSPSRYWSLEQRKLKRSLFFIEPRAQFYFCLILHSGIGVSHDWGSIHVHSCSIYVHLCSIYVDFMWNIWHLRQAVSKPLSTISF